MKPVAHLMSAPPAGKEHRKTPVSTRKYSRATLRFWTASLVLGLSVGASAAVAADQISYNYDALGRLQSVTYPNGTVVTYAYDPAGNRMQVTNTAGSGSTSSPQLPQQRRKLAAIQAILSILLGQ